MQVVVNRAFRTSRCLSFPFCSALSSLKQFVEWVSEEKKSYISANCQILLLPRPVCCYFGISVYSGAALSPRLGMPKMEACVYLTCNMRSSGCTEPESIISPPISTTDSRSPPPRPQPLRDGRKKKCSHSRDGRKRLTIYGSVCVVFSGRWTWTVTVQTIKQRPTGKLWMQYSSGSGDIGWRLLLVFRDQTRIYIDSFICHFFCINVKMYEKKIKEQSVFFLPDFFFFFIL